MLVPLKFRKSGRAIPAVERLSDLSRRLGVMGAGAAVLGDHFESGQDVDQSHIDNIQGVFDRFLGRRTVNRRPPRLSASRGRLRNNAFESTALKCAKSTERPRATRSELVQLE